MCIDCYCDLHTHHDMCKYPWIFQTQPYISFKDLCELIGEDELAAKVAEVYRNHSWFPYHLAQARGEGTSWYFDKVKAKPSREQTEYEQGVCRLRRCKCGINTDNQCTEYEAPENEGFCAWCKLPSLLHQETIPRTPTRTVARCCCICPDCTGMRRRHLRAQAEL